MNEMRLLLFSLLAGLLCPLLFSALPPWQPFAFGFVLLLVFCCLRSAAAVRPVMAFLLAFCWALF
ncbi:MAG: hypothetical protein CMK81_11545, partial [Pseudomonadales bacterium]|nr:hypothetical protein [Pseudomonadales bacterium]